ncbi:acyl-CoA dehydrogenase [Streptomyces sp. RerS4]|uniref:acyl-CoA dehydrogenase family protein n=1 Tax=Streptomyces sp. RerS4 TaxID=2942449 RepID=UPI00201BE9C4|nr:acyl-CoA dehydrogenase [Streptomyces sp. RerS4]UQX04440.1 acyl-CoA oxidase [Streptomyces sp. RerS4]
MPAARSAAGTGTGALVAALSRALFEEGPDPQGSESAHRAGGDVLTGGVHGPWRHAITHPVFRWAEGADTERRHDLAYARLRTLAAAAPATTAHDPRALAALHEWASAVDGAVATVAGIHYNLFLGSLLDDDLSAPRDLGPYLGMERTGTFLCTERAHGNDAAALETTARYDRARDGFVLHTPHPGAQKYMPNTGPAGGPKDALVAARLLLDGRDEGVFLFLTPLTGPDGPLPGVRIDALPDRTGDPVDHCVTSFDRVWLPRTALVQGPHGRLGADGVLRSDVGSARRRFLHAIARVTVGRLCMSAATLGGCRTALAVAVRYAGLRHVSGPAAGQRVPLSAHRSHRDRLLSCTARAYAMTLLHRFATERMCAHRPHERADAERTAALAKGWITWQARDIAIEARERCGARGLFPVNGLAHYPANIDGAITAEGDNLAVWCKAGAEMIFGHPLPEPPAPADGRERLTDPAFLRRLHTAVAHDAQRRARRDLRAGDPHDVLGRWNNAAPAALELVAARACALAADAFTAAVERTTDPAARRVLGDLCALFRLQTLRPETGPLLAAGHLTADQVLALPDELRVLGDRLAPYLPALTDAFGVPEEHLASLPLLSAADQGIALPEQAGAPAGRG